MSYDIEDVLDDVKAVMTSGFNSKITEINTAKNDGISMSSIDSNAYFLQSLDNAFASYDPFVFYGVVNITTNNSQRYSASEYTVTVMIVATDDGSGEAMTKKMLRYSRALRELFSNNWQSTKLANKLEISSFAPTAISGLNETKEHRIAAIELKTVIA